MPTPEAPQDASLIDAATIKLQNWAQRAAAEERHGKFAIEITVTRGKPTLIRELIDFTTK